MKFLKLYECELKQTFPSWGLGTSGSKARAKERMVLKLELGNAILKYAFTVYILTCSICFNQGNLFNIISSKLKKYKERSKKNYD